MKKQLNNIVITAIITLEALATSQSAYAGALSTKRIFINRTFTCNNTLQSIQWQNTTGATLFIKEINLGYSTPSGFSSTTIETKRVSDNMTLSYQKISISTTGSYAESFGSNVRPDYFTLVNNNRIQLNVSCGPSGTVLINGTLLYTIGSP